MTHTARYSNSSNQWEENNEPLAPSYLDAVNRQEALLYGRLGHLSQHIRHRIHSGLSYNQRVYTNAAPTNEERIRRRSEAQYRGVRSDVGNQEFDRVRDVLANRAIEATYGPVGTPPQEVQTQVNINFQHPYWNNRPRNEAEIIRLLRSSNMANALQDDGITFAMVRPGFDGVGFTEAQAQQIARRMLTWMNLRTNLQDNGVSSPNVALAMQMARDIPLDDLAHIMNPEEHHHEEQNQARARLNLFTLLENFQRLTRPTEPETDINTEITNIDLDINSSMSSPPPPGAPEPIHSQAMRRILGRPVNVASNFPVNPSQDRIERWGNSLSEARARLATQQANYQQIRAAGTTMANVFPALNMQIPAGLAQILVTGGFAPGLPVDVNFDPQQVAQRIRAAMNMTGESLSTLQTRVNELENHHETPPTGREVALSIFQAHFERREHMSQSEARRTANELYARNAVTHDEHQHMQNSFATQEVMGSEPIDWWSTDNVFQFGREALWGREESFVCNVAVGINRNMVSGWTRVPFLFRNPKAQPDWGRGSYNDLWAAFYALREAARSKDLTNTSYIRRQMNQIGEVLLNRRAKDVLLELDGRTLNDEERNRIRQLGGRAQIRAIIDTLMMQEVPEHLRGKMNGGLEYSRKWTGRSRKFTYDKLYKMWNPKEAAWYNPTAVPARIVRGGWKATKATARGVGGFFGGLWRSFAAAAMEKKAFIGRGGGHH